jgi:hypothetical protein
MERIAAEAKVAPSRISFVAALHLIQEEWKYLSITSSPGRIPRNLAELRQRIARYILPPRRPQRSFPRAVKIKMSNYARKRPVLSELPVK